MYTRNRSRSLFLLLASSFFLLFVSCQSGPVNAPALEGQCTVSFSVSNYRQISFDDLSSSNATRAVPTDHPSTLAHLLVAVFNAETGVQACSPIQHDYKDYETSPADYPKFSVTLPFGHYRVLVLGFNGSRACTIASLNHVSWADDYVPNTFLYCEELTLDKDASLNKEVTLRHVVSAFRVTAEDAIPADMKKMRFISTAGGTVLDALTGLATQNTGRTSDIAVPADSIGKQNVSFTAYLFLPAEQVNTNYTVQTLSASNAVICEKHFNNVPLRINYLTEWQGKAFEASSDDEEPSSIPGGFNIKWDTQWADTLRIAP